MTQVAFVKTQEGQAGVDKALDLLQIASTTMKGKDLFLKPNFNFPARADRPCGGVGPGRGESRTDRAGHRRCGQRGVRRRDP
jgi:hypothetical protein